MLAAAVAVHDLTAERLAEQRHVGGCRDLAGRRDVHDAIELQRAAALLAREDLQRGRVADQDLGLEIVELLKRVGQRVVDLEQLEVDEQPRDAALDRADERHARIVAVDRGVVREPELAFGAGLAPRASRRADA